jgi:predicted ATPase
MLLAASLTRPLCLVVEDLHWIDAETQEVLDSLVNGMTASRVLLLVTYRPEYRHAWASKSFYSQVGLDALPVESAGELLDALLGHDPGLLPLKQLLVGQGNPFFLEETVRMLVDTNVLAGDRGRYRLTHPVDSIAVPATVQAMLAARIDRLHAEDRHLLQVASVVGKDVPVSLLQAVADLPEEAVRRGLDRLQAAEFLYGKRVFPDSETPSNMRSPTKSRTAAFSRSGARPSTPASSTPSRVSIRSGWPDRTSGSPTMPSGGSSGRRPSRTSVGPAPGPSRDPPTETP